MPEENLKQTIEKYRKAVETGVDEEFGRTNNLSIVFYQRTVLRGYHQSRAAGKFRRDSGK